MKFNVIIGPFKIIKHIKRKFLAFFIFTIVLGQVAIWMPLMLKLANQSGFISTLSWILRTGTFYNTIIPLLAMSVYSLSYDSFIEKRKDYNTYKFSLLAIDFLMLFISAIFYSDQINATSNYKIVIQIILYIMSIYLILISYLSTFLYIDNETYHEIEDTEVRNIREKGNNTREDDRGNKI